MTGTFEADARDIDAFRRQRDEKAFRRLYRSHTARLYQSALRLVGGNKDEACDIVQETWVRAVQRIDTYEGRASFGAWLRGIAVNCFREMVRKSSRMVYDDNLEVVDLGAAREMRQSISRVDLERAIVRLPPGYREILVLHDIEGFTHEEIGKMLGIETGTSKSQLSRARRVMRSHLDAPGGVQDAR